MFRFVGFQHTAARRRLGRGYDDIQFSEWCFNTQPPEGGWLRFASFAKLSLVSTHSRPKAAGKALADISRLQHSFNTQPPEGGWSFLFGELEPIHCFNTQPPEGGWI